VILKADSDGVEQITEALKEYTNLTGIHILSHGAPASITLGNMSLTAGNLDKYSFELGYWKSSLTEQADILLYGCSIAEGKQGADFIEQLGELIGADIAVSDDLTGSAKLGGDWELEVSSGDIETDLAFEEWVLEEYEYLLGEDVVDEPLADYLLHPTLTGSAKDVLVNGLFELYDLNVIGNISTSPEFTDELFGAIPCLLDWTDKENPVAPNFKELIGDINLGKFFDYDFAKKVESGISTPILVDDFIIFMNGLDVTSGSTIIKVDVINNSLDHIVDDDYELWFDIIFNVERIKEYTFDLGKNADIWELKYGFEDDFPYNPYINIEEMPTIELKVSFSFHVTFGTILTLIEGDWDTSDSELETKVETIKDEFFLRETSLQALAYIYEKNFEFNLQVGFLEIEVVENTFGNDSSFVLWAPLEADLIDPDSIDPIFLDELSNISVDISSSGVYEAFLPVEVEVIDDSDPSNPVTLNSNFDTFNLYILLSGDPFDESIAPSPTDPRTAPPIELSNDFSKHLLAFNKITPEEVVNSLEQLQTWLGNVVASQIFNIVNIPFTDGLTLSKVLGFKYGIQPLLNTIKTKWNEVTYPKFHSAQEFARQLHYDLAYSLGLEYSVINPNFTCSNDSDLLDTHELTYHIVIDDYIVDFDLYDTSVKYLRVPIDLKSLEEKIKKEDMMNQRPLADIEFINEVDGFLNSFADLEFTIGFDLSTEPEIQINSESGEFGLRGLINPDTGNTFLPSDWQLVRNAEFMLNLGVHGSIDIILPAADQKILGFEEIQSGDGILTAINVCNPLPGRDVVFKFINGERIFIIKLPKSATDDNGTSITNLVNDLNDSLKNAINKKGYPQDISGAIKVGEDGTGRLTFTHLLTGGNQNMQIESIGCTYNNSSIDDLVDDLNKVINNALETNEINADIEVKAITDTSRDRLGFFTYDTNFMKIQDNSEDKDDPDRGFVKLGFLDGQIGSNSLLPYNGVLSEEASFWLTVGQDSSGYFREEIKVAQDTTNAGAPDPIEELLNDINISMDIGSIVDKVKIIRYGDYFSILPTSDDKFLQINDSNTIALMELGLLDGQISASVSILGERTVEIVGEEITSFTLRDDARFELKIDDETASFTIPAADAYLLGFTNNQYASNGILIADRNPEPIFNLFLYNICSYNRGIRICCIFTLGRDQ
jgi:hypothetical protein